jgi:hypothetical protein
LTLAAVNGFVQAVMEPPLDGSANPSGQLEAEMHHGIDSLKHALQSNPRIAFFGQAGGRVFQAFKRQNGKHVCTQRSISAVLTGHPSPNNGPQLRLQFRGHPPLSVLVDFVVDVGQSGHAGRSDRADPVVISANSFSFAILR